MSVFGKQSGGGRRTARRAPTPAVAVITTVTDSHNAMVVDLSETGVRLCSAIAPRLDQSLVITIEAIRAFGTVAWINGNEFGISFDEPIDRRGRSAKRPLVPLRQSRTGHQSCHR